ncbi:MAG TPA: AbrB/MazE/SpoVT family DNA-binding domain-containing protein [Usitatibacter sp.]|nr:AbrB/MazE/SpoVT family DNA-binding domain-containing protein [Usitatibacter sp.]
MIAKLTSKNQLTLPKALVRQFPGTTYFEVSEERGRIVLTPLNLQSGDSVRAKLAELGIEAKDVRAAIRWARDGK